MTDDPRDHDSKTFDELCEQLGVNALDDRDNPIMLPAVLAYEAFVREMVRRAMKYRRCKNLLRTPLPKPPEQ